MVLSHTHKSTAADSSCPRVEGGEHQRAEQAEYQGLPLLHFSAQPQPSFILNPPNMSHKKCLH